MSCTQGHFSAFAEGSRDWTKDVETLRSTGNLEAWSYWMWFQRRNDHDDTWKHPNFVQGCDDWTYWPSPSEHGKRCNLCNLDTSEGQADIVTCTRNVRYDGETLLHYIAERKTPNSIIINHVEIQSPFFASILATTYALNLTPASKHHLAVYLKRTIEASCHAFLTIQAPHILRNLRLHTSDTIDINIWITLIGHLRLHEKLPTNAFAPSASGESPWPKINTWCFEKINPSTDTITRLRHVVVHRWDFDTYLLRDVISFLALLNDSHRLTEVQTIFLKLHESRDATIPQSPCITPIGLITRLVAILERTLHAFALACCPTVLKPGEVKNPHASELHHLAAALEAFLAAVPGLPDEKLKEIKILRENSNICRALRNAAAHHTSFSREAIQLRRWSRCPRPYDTCSDPYTAMVDDAVKIASWLGNSEAVRELEAAGHNFRKHEEPEEQEEDDDDGVEECTHRKFQSEEILSSMHNVDPGSEELCDRVAEAAAYWGNRAAEKALTVRVHPREVDLGPGGVADYLKPPSGVTKYKTDESQVGTGYEQASGVARSSAVMVEETPDTARWEECIANVTLRKRASGASAKYGFSAVAGYLKRSSEDRDCESRDKSTFCAD